MHEPNFDRRAAAFSRRLAEPPGELLSLISDAVHEMTMSVLWPLKITEAAIEIASNFTNGVYRGQGIRFGDGKPVILVPGRLSGDFALTPLRLWLEAIGYRAEASAPLVGLDDHAIDESLAAVVNDTTRRIGRKGVLVAFDIGIRSALRVAAAHSNAVSDVIAVSMPSRLPAFPPGVRLHVIERAGGVDGRSQADTYRVLGSEMAMSINPQALRIISGILRDIPIELL